MMSVRWINESVEFIRSQTEYGIKCAYWELKHLAFQNALSEIPVLRKKLDDYEDYLKQKAKETE